MKQRFSSLDVKVIAHELSKSLVSLRLSNVYDLSSKILLLKFAKPEVKQQLLLDAGFRCHLTDFVRTTAAAPSVFVQKLRKALKTRRVTAVSQIGTDRIIEFQFSDGQYRLYLEFFASGNVILTDNELKILTLLHTVPEGEGQEPQRPGLTYALDNRQNYGGVPPLTKDRLQDALRLTVEKNAAAAATATGKKIKRKTGDELRRGLARTITEVPPMLVDHAMKVTGFDSTAKPTDVLEDEALLDHLLRALMEARRVSDEVTSSDTCKGYILAKTRPGTGDAQVETGVETGEGDQQKKHNLLYEDFHPFLPRQFEEDSAYTVIPFDSFNKLVDDFFSSIEGQKLESRLNEREAAAKRKLDAAKADQTKRIEGLKATQQLNVRKANAIEANIERVQEAIDAVNGLIHQGMDWEDISKLIDRERRRNNPVATIIIPPLKLHENTITVLLAEAEDDEDEDDAYETDSSSDDSDFVGTDAAKEKGKETRLTIDINLGISPYSNAGEYHGERKAAAVKEEKTTAQSDMALEKQKQRIAAELKKGLKQEKPVLHPVRKQLWFEKFIWFISSDGYLVLGGKDAQQNETIYRRYLKKGDIYVHADLHGAPSVVIKNNPSTPDAPIPPSTLSQAGSLSVCASSAWDSKAAMSAWWVTAEQVSKSAPSGEYLPTGSFMIRDQKNYLPAAQLILGFALLFKVSEESKAKHVKHRLYDGIGPAPTAQSENMSQASTVAGSENPTVVDDEIGGSNTERADSDSEDSAVDVNEDDEQPTNPLQPSASDGDEAEPESMEAPAPSEEMGGLAISEEPASTETSKHEPVQEDEGYSGDDDALETENATDSPTPISSTIQSKSASGKSTPQPQKRTQQPKRGQKGKAKKIAAKYRDQDEDDRAAIESLIGAAAGKQRAEAEARAKAEREAQQKAALERRRAQHRRQQKETAEHEEIRRVMLEEGLETLDPDEVANLSLLDSLVGTPLPGDEILECIPICAPYAALSRCKFKVKLQPGSQKKGKAVKEILEAWKAVSGRKGVIDEAGQDKEKMWPREVELLKGLKAEEVINTVPVRQVRVMAAGGASASGGGSGSGGGGGQGKGKGKGGKGGKGKKK
ncbi:fibronectin-binding protein A N-terminus-domain-containing protein [Xylariomycetidae sp. FL2044]|nr:fibronectin-binding protein A N-terminus-domain-containing protein [Xylariomycetidae sp. FL2044]